MPGLVKVGKTTRDPAGRANELSNTTGVPTPFVVAFDNYFEDCDAAEAFVHMALEVRGLREAKNREFFRASAAEVVKILINIPDKISSEPESVIDHNADNEDILISTSSYNNKSIMEKRKPWEEILEKAHEYNFGFDDKLQDIDEALFLYKQAAKLGSISAYWFIANIYLDDDNVHANFDKALYYYKQGAKMGNYYCFSGMAGIYRTLGMSSTRILRLEYEKNEEKCWNNFFKMSSKNFFPELELFEGVLFLTYYSYILTHIEDYKRIYNIEYLIIYRNDIKLIADQEKTKWKKLSDMIIIYRASRWINKNLLSAPKNRDDTSKQDVSSRREISTQIATPARKRFWQFW